MKKQRVSAALHFELTEYASLLRALRTRDAMDLTANLTKPSPFTLPPQNESVVNHKRNRDQWTRWPLLLEDVPIPEWSLEDEVAVIASRVMKSRSTPTLPHTTDHVMSSEFDEDDPDHPFYVPYLTSGTTSLLSTIFSLLAQHTPARPASMQNRIEPLNWRSVIDVLVNCNNSEYANPKVLENVIRRMETIYGPSFSPLEGKMATSYRAVDRIRIRKAAIDRIPKLFEEPMTSLFSQASPPPYTSPPVFTPPPSPPPKRKRDQILSPGERNYKVRKHWVPKSKRNEEHETEYNGGSQHSNVPVRRSTRARSKVSYNVDDAAE